MTVSELALTPPPRWSARMHDLGRFWCSVPYLRNRRLTLPTVPTKKSRLPSFARVYANISPRMAPLSFWIFCPIACSTRSRQPLVGACMVSRQPSTPHIGSLLGADDGSHGDASAAASTPPRPRGTATRSPGQNVSGTGPCQARGGVKLR